MTGGNRANLRSCKCRSGKFPVEEISAGEMSGRGSISRESVGRECVSWGTVQKL